MVNCKNCFHRAPAVALLMAQLWRTSTREQDRQQRSLGTVCQGCRSWRRWITTEAPDGNKRASQCPDQERRKSQGTQPRGAPRPSGQSGIGRFFTEELVRLVAQMLLRQGDHLLRLSLDTGFFLVLQTPPQPGAYELKSLNAE